MIGVVLVVLGCLGAGLAVDIVYDRKLRRLRDKATGYEWELMKCRKVAVDCERELEELQREYVKARQLIEVYGMRLKDSREQLERAEALLCELSKEAAKGKGRHCVRGSDGRFVKGDLENE